MIWKNLARSVALPIAGPLEAHRLYWTLLLGLFLMPTATKARGQEPYPTEFVPRLSAMPAMTIPKHTKEFSRPWRMRQAWLPKEETKFLAGTVSMAWEPAAFWCKAILPDREIFSSSTGDGQHLWELGDVFEIFIRRDQSPAYLELHVSPNGHRLHLRWTAKAMQRVRERSATVQDFARDPRAFDAKVVRLPGKSGWAVSVRLPAGIFPEGEPFHAGELLFVSFSRYDADKEGKNAVLSSTSAHKELSFHRLKEWRPVILQ